MVSGTPHVHDTNLEVNTLSQLKRVPSSSPQAFGKLEQTRIFATIHLRPGQEIDATDRTCILITTPNSLQRISLNNQHPVFEDTRASVTGPDFERSCRPQPRRLTMTHLARHQNQPTPCRHVLFRPRLPAAQQLRSMSPRRIRITSSGLGT